MAVLGERVMDRNGKDGGLSEVELVRQVAAGSETALALLYDKHAATVFHVAMALNRDHGVAEEVVQETFLALWNRAELFDPTLGSLTAWLSTIARNRAVDRLRATGRRIPAAPFSAFATDAAERGSTAEWLVAAGSLVATGAQELSPEAALARSESRADVATALTTLPGPERQAILLAYRDGLSQSEIAEHLGWPLGTVKTRSRRALQRMRETLAPTPPSSMVPSRGSARERRAPSPGTVEACCG